LPVPAATADRAELSGAANDALFLARNNGPLSVALGLSLVFHSILLLITFSYPDAFNKNARTPIEVVLVNSKSSSRPVKADALAQANLDGGGNTEAARRAKTNLPALPDMPSDAELSLASKRVQQLETETQRVLAQLKAGQAPINPKTLPVQQTTPNSTPNQADLPNDQLMIAKLEAQIARELQAYQELPRRKFIGARTESVPEAQYLDDWRQRIERVGTANFPVEAKRHGVLGTVMVTVAIRADGSVEKVEIDRSSGSSILDAAVEKIVMLAGPFRPFPEGLRKEADILHITRNWAFTRTDLLITTDN
jgi:protein TonB